MKQHDGRPDKGGGDPENRRKRNGLANGPPARRPPGYVSRAVAGGGRSGYGSESVRPYLRAQLKMKELLMPPPPLDDNPGREDEG
jgi:hypothetical protein